MIWFIIFLLFWTYNALARVEKQPCGNCHTMHYSQGGKIIDQWNPSGPFKALLIKDCIGCHTGINTENSTVPYIFSPDPPVYGETGTESGTNTLAGGNFYWVQTDDAKGHNVWGITTQKDQNWGTVPPGGRDMQKQITCAGKYGCHGNPDIEDDFESILGAHHTRDETIDGTTVGKSYRFLFKVVGYEDPHWEYQPNSKEHNQYKGIDRSSDIELDFSTISALCSRCHPDYHQDISTSSIGSPWFRHPTDYDLGHTKTDSEYRNYPGKYGSEIGEYSVIVPVASEDVSKPINKVSFSDDAIITCISCHRAHGSPYPRILRWNYFNWPGGTSINGCNACHTAKD